MEINAIDPTKVDMGGHTLFPIGWGDFMLTKEGWTDSGSFFFEFTSLSGEFSGKTFLQFLDFEAIEDYKGRKLIAMLSNAFNLGIVTNTSVCVQKSYKLKISHSTSKKTGKTYNHIDEVDAIGVQSQAQAPQQQAAPTQAQAPGMPPQQQAPQSQQQAPWAGQSQAQAPQTTSDTDIPF